MKRDCIYIAVSDPELKRRLAPFSRRRLKIIVQKALEDLVNTPWFRVLEEESVQRKKKRGL